MTIPCLTSILDGSLVLPLFTEPFSHADFFIFPFLRFSSLNSVIHFMCVVQQERRKLASVGTNKLVFFGLPCEVPFYKPPNLLVAKKSKGWRFRRHKMNMAKRAKNVKATDQNWLAASQWPWDGWEVVITTLSLYQDIDINREVASNNLIRATKVKYQHMTPCWTTNIPSLYP